MLIFLHPHVSSRVSGSPVASPCLWGKPQNLSFSKVSKQVVMSFCVAGVALCDIPICLMTCRKCQDWRKSRTKCSFFCAHVSRLESLVFLWRRRVYGGSSALHTLHCTLLTPHSTLYTPHFTLCTLHSSLLTWDSTLHTLHFTHSTLLTPHSTLYTFHSTLHTLHSTLHILHCTLLTPHSTLYTPHFTLHTPHSSLYTPHSTLHTLHFPLHTPHFTLHTPHSTLYTPHSTLYTLYTPHSTLYTPHSLLYTPHSTLYTFHSTLQTGNRGNMYKTVQINYCRKVLCVTAYPCVLTSVPLTYLWAFGFVGCILFFARYLRLALMWTVKNTLVDREL